MILSRFSRKTAFLLLLGCASCSVATSSTTADEAANVSSGIHPNIVGFRPMRLGGGGYVVDLDTSRDGKTVVARTDVHGAYRWDRQANAWQQLVTAQSMSTEDHLVGTGNAIGVYAIRVAPTD